MIIGCATQPSELPTTYVSPNELPPCPSSGAFHNCFGTFTFTNGNEYVGEWKDNKYHGYGTFKISDGDKYVGEFWNQRRHGYGVLTRANGEVSQGVWLDGRFRNEKELNKNRWIPLARKGESQTKVNHNSGFNPRKMNHRNHPDNPRQIQIKTPEKTYLYVKGMSYYADGACRGLKGTGLAKVLTKPIKKNSRQRRGLTKYPKLVTASCMTEDEWAEEQVRLAKVREVEKKQLAEKRVLEEEVLEQARNMSRLPGEPQPHSLDTVPDGLLDAIDNDDDCFTHRMNAIIENDLFEQTVPYEDTGIHHPGEEPNPFAY